MFSFLLIILHVANCSQKLVGVSQNIDDDIEIFAKKAPKCSFKAIQREQIQNHESLASFQAFVGAKFQILLINTDIITDFRYEGSDFLTQRPQSKIRNEYLHQRSQEKMIRNNIAYYWILNAVKQNTVYQLSCKTYGKKQHKALVVLEQNASTTLQQIYQLNKNKSRKLRKNITQREGLDKRRLLVVVCDPTCQTCSTATKCTSCNATATYRVLNGNDCECGVGYCSNNGTICGKCHPVCHDCANQDTNCISCDTRYYNIAGNRCNLKGGPVPCHVSCLTCGGTARNQCLTCSSANHRSFYRPNYTCLCDDGYFEDNVNAACRTCHYSCKNCDSYQIDHCTGCLASDKRIFQSSYCNCFDGFYDDGVNSLCATCHYSCATCTSATGCLTCQAGRSQQYQGSLCFCPNGKYDPGSATCLDCSYQCLTCSGSANTCTSCQPLNLRTQLLNSCPCNQGYFDNGAAYCSTCSYTCQSCWITSTTCVTCDSSNHRIKQSNNCPCNVGYYDVSVPLCAQCHYTCRTCQTTSTNCQSCQSDYYRTLQGSNCICQPGYFESGSNICSQCNYTCASCNINSTNCLSCPATRSQIFNQCPCSDGYYDAGVSQCMTCSYKCQTCQEANYCLSCLSTNFRALTNSFCDCFQGYYDQGVAVCSKCNYTCFTCNISSNNCLSCHVDNRRTLLGSSCVCDIGFYDIGVSQCIQCDLKCLSCQTTSFNCLSCSALNFRYLVGNTCPCLSGYFELGLQNCLECNNSCATCTSSTNCTSCVANRTLSLSNVCECSDKFYLDPQSNQCFACHYSCKTCNGSLKHFCQSCTLTSQRGLSSGQCLCLDGYYDDGNGPQCNPCHQTCRKCYNGTQNDCLSCNQTFNRILSNSSCVCNVGYFENQTIGICQNCNYQCFNCYGYTPVQCTGCDINKFRQFSNGSCICIQGFYDDGQNQTCQKCHYSCQSCNKSEKCLTCDQNYFRLLTNDFCQCFQGYYDSNIHLCSRCHYSCFECNDSSDSSCIDCQSFSTYRSHNNGFCICPSGYFDDGVNQNCQLCHYSCRTCIGASLTQCLSCGISRYFNEGQCTCLNGTFDDSINETCQNCTNNCLTCENKSNQCVACDSRLNRILNQTSKTCECKDGYYDAEVASCLLCMENCAICQNQTFCLKCLSNMVFSSSQKCECPATQYFDSQSSSCKSCIKPCVECQSPSICLSCVENRTLSKRNTCQCILGSQEASDMSCQDCSLLPFSRYDNKTRKCECLPGYSRNSQSVCSRLDCSENQILIDGKCQCNTGYISINSICQLDINRKPCTQQGCSICEDQKCHKCSDKFYKVDSSCYQCDKRCSKCQGPRNTDCLECQYVRLDGQCAYCEAVSGLFTKNEKCIHFCGDGQVYYETEQCDDGNSIDNDGCDNKCRITPPYVDAYLDFQNNYSIYEGYRIAQVGFSNGRTPNYSEWQFLVPEDSKVKITLWNSSSQIFVGMNFSQTFTFLTLQINIPPNLFINQNQLKGKIPPYRLISGIQRRRAGQVLEMNTQLMYLIIIIMVSCFLTGGMSMIYNIMDLFQMISYLKYINVQFPYNVDIYMTYMGQFNFQYLSNEIPVLDKMMAELSSQFYNDPDLVAPYKFAKDGYITLFWVNIVPVLFIWFSSVTIFLISVQLRKVLLYYYSIDNVNKYQGVKQKLYILRFKVVHIVLVSLDRFTQNFFWMSVFRIFMQSAYDFNFALFLEISNSQLLHKNSFHSFGSFLCCVLLSLEGLLILKIFLDMLKDDGQVLQSKTYQDRIGAFIEGINFQQKGPVRFCNLIFTTKKIAFMAVLISLYHYPLVQIVTISILHFCQFMFTIIHKPLESTTEQIKQCTCDLTISVCCLLFITFYINEETRSLSDEDELTVGWVIIALLLLSLFVEIIFDIYENVLFLIGELRRLSKFIKRLKAKKQIAEILNQERDQHQKAPNYNDSMIRDLGSTIDIISLDKSIILEK